MRTTSSCRHAAGRSQPEPGKEAAQERDWQGGDDPENPQDEAGLADHHLGRIVRTVAELYPSPLRVSAHARSVRRTRGHCAPNARDELDLRAPDNAGLAVRIGAFLAPRIDDRGIHSHPSAFTARAG